MKNKMQILKLSEIKFDENLYPRSRYNWMVAYDYSQSMKAGSKFPPITVALYNRKYLLVDGKHRMEGKKICKETHIQAEVLSGLSYDEIYIEAVRRNTEHGYNLSPYDKRNIIVKLQKMNLSSEQISGLIKIPMKNLEGFVMKKLTNTITGREVVLKSPLGHLSEEIVDDNLENEQSIYNVRTQMAILGEVISLIKNGYLNLEHPMVNTKLAELKRLLRGKIVQKKRRGK